MEPEFNIPATEGQIAGQLFDLLTAHAGGQPQFQIQTESPPEDFAVAIKVTDTVSGAWWSFAIKEWELIQISPAMWAASIAGTIVHTPGMLVAGETHAVEPGDLFYG